MRRNTLFVEAPPLVLVTLGGAVATILATALMYLAPALGLTLIDVPSLIGGLWTSDRDTALWSGYVVFFLGGWLVVPLTLWGVWNALPGSAVGFGGAALKGLAAGAAAWLLCGAFIGLLGLVSDVSGLASPGWYGFGAGTGAAASLLVGHLAYGLALAIVAGMGQGISPMRAIGWLGHGAGREA